MQRILIKLAMMIAAAFVVSASPAMAQATRTWVSGVGDDANPCSRTAPCKTFQGALSKTAASGEINVLDPGGYGPVTINKSITIRSDSIIAGVLVTSSGGTPINGIVINAASTDKVVLDGLDFEGVNIALSGIRIVSAREVEVKNSVFRNFTVAGISLVGASKTFLTVDHDSFFNNAIGIAVTPASTALNTARVSNTTIATSATAGIQLNGTLATGYISNDVITGTPKALDLTGGAVMNSYGNNVLNGTATDTPTLTPLQ